jgi:hypothetical protein
VASGLRFYKVNKIGPRNRNWKIGSSILSIEETTPLQAQIEKFVKVMALSRIVIFFWFGLSILENKRSVK